MAFQLTEVRVTKLHGLQDVRIPIQDNRIVMVGVNGLGKTTFLNLLYYFLSHQWRRLFDYDFAVLEVDINGETLQLSKADMSADLDDLRQVRRVLATMAPDLEWMVTRDSDLLRLITTASPNSPSVLHALREAGLSTSSGSTRSQRLGQHAGAERSL